MKKLLLLLLLLPVLACEQKPLSYDECIIESMEGIDNDTAAALVLRSCRNLFPEDSALPELDETTVMENTISLIDLRQKLFSTCEASKVYALAISEALIASFSGAGSEFTSDLFVDIRNSILEERYSKFQEQQDIDSYLDLLNTKAVLYEAKGRWMSSLFESSSDVIKDSTISIARNFQTFWRVELNRECISLTENELSEFNSRIEELGLGEDLTPPED